MAIEGIQLSQEEKNKIARAIRFRSIVSAEGFPDLKKLLQDIEDEALEHLYKYDGTEDHETAVRAFQWKIIRAHKLKLLGRIEQKIEEGTAVAMSKVPKEALEEEAAASVAVRPQCDMDAEAPESEAEAPPRPPVP